MTLREICVLFDSINFGLMSGTQSFKWDKLQSAMGCCHPSNQLEQCYAQIANLADRGIDPGKEKIDECIAKLNSFQSTFQLEGFDDIIQFLIDWNNTEDRVVDIEDDEDY